MAKIDIANLDEQELVELNRSVIERLHILRDARAHHYMQEFQIGDQVWFMTEFDQKITGTVVRFNRKTVTLACQDGSQWRVSPMMLFPVGDEDMGHVPIQKAYAGLRLVTASLESERRD